jgi:hypothetical protein
LDDGMDAVSAAALLVGWLVSYRVLLGSYKVPMVDSWVLCTQDYRAECPSCLLTDPLTTSLVSAVPCLHPACPACPQVPAVPAPQSRGSSASGAAGCGAALQRRPGGCCCCAEPGPDKVPTLLHGSAAGGDEDVSCRSDGSLKVWVYLVVCSCGGCVLCSCIHQHYCSLFRVKLGFNQQ